MNKNLKGLFIAIISMLFVLASAVTAFASEYTIYDAWWECNESAGKVVIRWDKCEKSTKYKVELFRNSYEKYDTKSGKSVLNKTVSGSSYDVSSVIGEKGKGTYYFVITPVSSPSPLDDMYISLDDMLDVDSAFAEKIKKHNAQEQKATNITGWMKTATAWKYVSKGAYVTDGWKKIDGYWYYFNKSGEMLTGWLWVNARCYYLNPVQGAGGYPEGACWINGTTPDGYTVDASGAWTVNGYIQTK